MDKRIVQNAINFLLSDRLTFSGEDFLPLAEIIRELQAVVGNGGKEPSQSGDNKDPES